MVTFPDLSGHRMVSVGEVAVVFDVTVAAVRQRIYNGTFPVMPKQKRPFKWSSAELRAWFENDKKRAL